MPNYEFRCGRCQKGFEAHQTVMEHGQKLPPCPACGSTQSVERQLSVFSAVTPRKS